MSNSENKWLRGDLSLLCLVVVVKDRCEVRVSLVYLTILLTQDCKSKRDVSETKDCCCFFPLYAEQGFSRLTTTSHLFGGKTNGGVPMNFKNRA